MPPVLRVVAAGQARQARGRLDEPSLDHRGGRDVTECNKEHDPLPGRGRKPSWSQMRRTGRLTVAVPEFDQADFAE